MAEFWEYELTDTPEFVHTYDELPLWSAPFGLLLLQHVQLKPGQVVLDIGCGTGFPLLELAERLGTTCKCYGLDPWAHAAGRTRSKAAAYGIGHVEMLQASAEAMPFENGYIDMAVSNLGINNFSRPQQVFAECYRVLKPGGKLALTTNLNGHWKEFYRVFEDVLVRLNKPAVVEKLQQQQVHRGTVQTVTELFTGSGFNIARQVEDSFEMRFLNGSALLNHHFIKLGWMQSWSGIVEENDRAAVFGQLEASLNQLAETNGGLTLTVPMAYIEGQKPQ